MVRKGKHLLLALLLENRAYKVSKNFMRNIDAIVAIVLFINAGIFFILWMWIQSFGGWSPVALPCLSGAILNFLFIPLWAWASAHGSHSKMRLLAGIVTGSVLIVYGTSLICLALGFRVVHMLIDIIFLGQFGFVGLLMIFSGLLGVLSLLTAIGIFLSFG